MAKKSVFSSKLASKSVLILDDFSFEKPNSKKCIKMLSDLGISSNKSLLISEDKNDNLLISSRNVKKVSLRHFKLPAWDILKYPAHDYNIESTYIFFDKNKIVTKTLLF